VLFRQAIHVGELVSFLASVNHTGRSSMAVGIKVLAEDIPTRKQRHVNSCYFTMVAVEEGKPVAIPELAIATDVQARRHREDQARKSARLELSKQFSVASS
jgi:acyl-CoA hydrolase